MNPFVPEQFQDLAAEVTPQADIQAYKNAAAAALAKSDTKLQSFHATVADLTGNQIPNEEHHHQHLAEYADFLNNFQEPAQG